MVPALLGGAGVADPELPIPFGVIVPEVAPVEKEKKKRVRAIKRKKSDEKKSNFQRHRNSIARKYYT